MESKTKLTLLIVVAVSLGGLEVVTMTGMLNPFAEGIEPEIDQNQVEDEISRTIVIHLEDGLTFSDDLK